MNAEVLEKIYKKAYLMKNDSKKIKLTSPQKLNVDILLTHIDSNKSFFSALVTSLFKKIINPQQDIRLHKVEFQGGYSARSLDHNVTTPFLNKYFPKYGNRDTGLLSLATRVNIKWTLEEEKNIRARNKYVLKSFLEILDSVENKIVHPENYLLYVFMKIIELSREDYKLFKKTIGDSKFQDIVNIAVVLKMLEVHFEEKQSSRLPVIAIYSIYQELLNNVRLYQNKKLLNLNVHTSSDKHGYGDIELRNSDNTPFEVVEIKHNIPIDRNLIFHLQQKAEKTSIKRFFILTTHKDNFKSKEEESIINDLILKIKNDSGLDIIANGIITTLKYYLRFIPDLNKFIQTYTTNLIEDAKQSTEVKNFHIKKWNEILKSHKILTSN